MIVLKREGKKIAATFTKNAELQEAFQRVKEALPTGWLERRRVEWVLYPVDEEYGDVLSTGFVGATYGIGSV